MRFKRPSIGRDASAAICCMSIFAAAACSQGADVATTAQERRTSPPQFQIRDKLPASDRLATTNQGASLFSHHCGYCHLEGGMGTNVLPGQQVAMGNSAARGLLAKRDDLTADYVKAVVRSGKSAMPALTRVDITDAELDAVASYLAKARK